MEVVSCKDCTRREGDQVHVEDVEACGILSVSKNQLECFWKQSRNYSKGQTQEDTYLQKLGDLDRC